MILNGFIVFEGLDGSGTTTQCRLLADRLNAVFTCEPSESCIGQFIRQILRKEHTVEPKSLARLFAADRYEHIYGDGGIVCQINDGQTVICDRYLFSSLSYQSLDCDFDEIYQFNRDFPLPQTVFFIDTPVEECIRRITDRPSQPELFERAELQRRIYDNYQQAFEAYRSCGLNLVTLDGTKSVEALLAEELHILGR